MDPDEIARRLSRPLGVGGLPDAEREVLERARARLAETVAGDRVDRVIDSRPAEEPPASWMPPTWTPIERIGVGGMGEVWRVRDQRLGADVALKTLRPDLADDEGLAAAFLTEARLTAGLQHPGIVPVHELGVLRDGRPFYTMRLVTGQSADRLLEAWRASALSGDPPPGRTRQMVHVIHRVAEAVGYAHARSVVHRDVKPANVRVGDHGEVVVLDWGLATPVDQAGPEAVGTVEFMAPEVRAGQRATPASDVYSLGMWLAGVAAFGPGGPDGHALAGIVARATAADPAARPSDAVALARLLSDWLDGARRREEALALVGEADGHRAELRRMEQEIGARQRAVAALNAAIPPWAAEADKRPLWSAQERLEQAGVQVVRREVEWRRCLDAALARDPGCDEAHRRFADHYRALHQAAEEARDQAAALRWEALLQEHDRGEHATWLAGMGRFTVITDPPGAEVQLWRYVEVDRRLVATDSGRRLSSPAWDVEVPWGSWLLKIQAPGRPEVLHPIFVPRAGREDGIAPGETSPRPIRLPEAAPEGCAYVTPGWTRIGGDPGSPNGLPARRVWVEGVFMMQHHVTNASWLTFVQSLADEGRVEEALRHAPRERVAVQGTLGRLIYGWDGQRFSLEPDAEGDVWRPEWPVLMIDLDAAEAYARWRSAADGRAWRVPREDEWERAARGADGRIFPWGDRFDATWACCRLTHPDGVRPSPHPVGAHPVDRSPFGIFDLAGNARDWTGNVWGGDVEMERVHPTLRGGGWNSPVQVVRCATRAWSDRSVRPQAVSFRLVCPVDG